MINVLHISFHKGCQNDIEYVSKKLNFNLTFMPYKDETVKGNDVYNITHDRALNIWNKNKDYYNSFDVIITSDTTPISRVFLQNNFQKKLIIWICNRFDYAHQPDGDNIGFPDQEYYDLINDAKNRKNVIIVGYTPFENYYANEVKNMSIGNEIIKPIGKISDVYSKYTSTIIEDKENTILISPYHNETIYMNLYEKLKVLDLKLYGNKYNGPMDLSEFAGVIHLPYAWSNLAFFEAIQLNIVYFVPSINFLMKLFKKKENTDYWFQNSTFINKINLCEWYQLEHKDLLVYFDSWEDLKYKIKNLDFKKQKEIIKKFTEKHEDKYLKKWKKYIVPIE